MLGLNHALGVSHIPFVGAPAVEAGGAFPVNAVKFDGANDWLKREGALTGAADSENFLMSLWFNVLGSDDENTRIWIDSSSRILLSRTPSNKLEFWVRTSAPLMLWHFNSTASFNSSTNTGWHHLLIAAQLDVTPVGLVFLDDSALAKSDNTAPVNGSIDFTTADHFVAANDGSGKFNGELAEFYLTNEFLDISVEANRRKFIDGNGFPVDLSANGSTPTGTAPLVFFSGATASWHINKGSGQGFTEVGALTDAATNPSD